MASAASAEAGDTPLSVTVYAGRGVDANLIDLLPQALKGDLRFDPTYLAAVAVHRAFDTPPAWQRAFDAVGAPRTRLGVEGVLARHNGLQDHVEVAGAFTLRFAPWVLGALHVQPALGVGLSYAAGRPGYEDPPDDGDPSRRYRLQLFNVYELAWAPASANLRWAVVTRVHHRSGAYGLLAPRGAGSNFVAVGVRFTP